MTHGDRRHPLLQTHSAPLRLTILPPPSAGPSSTGRGWTVVANEKRAIAKHAAQHASKCQLSRGKHAFPPFRLFWLVGGAWWRARKSQGGYTVFTVSSIVSMSMESNGVYGTALQQYFTTAVLHSMVHISMHTVNLCTRCTYLRTTAVSGLHGIGMRATELHQNKSWLVYYTVRHYISR